MNLLVICYITVISELLYQLYNLVTNEKCQILWERRVKYVYISDRNSSDSYPLFYDLMLAWEPTSNQESRPVNTQRIWINFS